ncbi:MAG TPA: NADH-quinone oxidoreductase subunit NuoF [Chlamydiales bacterium]|nr:NADH-quinone oxidoreductase subunit NuoF [Chlamydiales bacterium]
MSNPQEKYTQLKKESEHFLNQNIAEDEIIITVGSATCENAAGSNEILDEIEKHIRSSGKKNISIKKVGCTGRCSLEPIVSVTFPGNAPIFYASMDREKVHELFISHIMQNTPIEKYFLKCADDSSYENKEKKAQDILEKEAITHKFFTQLSTLPFYCSQTRIALRNCGLIDPESIEEYIQNEGFSALAQKLAENNPHEIIETVTNSNLRGRGGAGFPTGKKWSFAVANKEKKRYLICNADEGDPGAFMDRSMLESDPFSVVEGMILAGFAIGAQKGYFYIRAEYPLAIKRIEQAIKTCYEKGLLGKNILDSNFSFDLEIRLGAGAFVCGEETALIHSIEGERGQPRIRPPFPAVEGLFGYPTIINNVETLANLPVVMSFGADKFKKIGTEKSGGTKVFAVSGKVCHTGLVEVPMGTTLREIVYDICGGVPNGKKLKAIQTGGPAGGCIPEHLLDTPIDYEALIQVGSMMGSGGLIVLDEDDCMVNVAKYFMSFSQDESCGKCSPCREGTLRMLEILEKITEGKASIKDLENLERLAKLVQKSALCGLGKGAPNPILSTLRYFKDEYLAHIQDKKCPAKQCNNLTHFEIDPEKCVGCTACARKCPVSCISGNRREPHVIDQSKCIKCGKCQEVCKFNAVLKI